MTTLASFGKLSRKAFRACTRVTFPSLNGFESQIGPSTCHAKARKLAYSVLLGTAKRFAPAEDKTSTIYFRFLELILTQVKKTFLKAYSPLDEDVIIISREIVCLNLKSHSLSRCCLLSFSSLFNSLLTKRVYSCLISHFGVLGRRRPFSRQNRLSRFVHLQLGDDTLGRVDADLHGSACDLF